METGQQVIQVFNNPQFGDIRTAGTSDNPMFCLSDLCKVLGLSVKGVNQRLEKEVISNYPLLTNGGNQVFTFVNEDGLYDVILDSRKPKAKAFRKWVTSEVLPSIRKTGSYSVNNLSRKELAQMVIKSEEEKEMLQIENNKLKADVSTQQNINCLLQGEIDSMQPKVRIYDDVIENQNDTRLSTTSSVANEIGMSAQQLNKMLIAKGIIYKEQSGDYLFTSEYRNWGLGRAVSTLVDETRGIVKTYIKWNTRGRAYIHALHATNWDKRRAWHLLKDGRTDN